MTNDELRLLRGRLNVTQLEMAQDTGYSLSYIQKLEQGTLPITDEFESRLFKVYNFESSFRRSYQIQQPPKTDWGDVICFAIFFIFLILFMVINR